MFNNMEYDCENLNTLEYNEYLYQKQNRIIKWGKNLFNIVKHVVYYPINAITKSTTECNNVV
jgi:hypothetical protein